MYVFVRHIDQFAEWEKHKDCKPGEPLANLNYRVGQDTVLTSEAKEGVMAKITATGCNPISAAVKAGEELFTPVKPDTIARSIAIGSPADGYYAIETIRRSGGWAEDATDDEIVEALKLLAETEGIFTEPAGGTTLACAIKLIQSGKISRDESVCVCITGNGLKTVEVMQGQFAATPAINAPSKLLAAAPITEPRTPRAGITFA